MLLSALGEVIPTIVSLFCYTKQNVSHLRSVKAWVMVILKYLVNLSALMLILFRSIPCQEILQWYLCHVEPSSALLLLKHLCVVQAGGGGVAPGYHFSPGSEGGVRLVRKDPVRWQRCSIMMWRYVTEVDFPRYLIIWSVLCKQWWRWRSVWESVWGSVESGVCCAALGWDEGNRRAWRIISLASAGMFWKACYNSGINQVSYLFPSIFYKLHFFFFFFKKN